MQFYPNSMSGINNNSIGSLVGIILRTKNRPILLTRALASILSQNYQDWHIYLVNDGGDTRQLNEVLKSYLPAIDGRIQVINIEQSVGMEAASNAALSVMKADFLTVHDDDDSWHPDFLIKTTELLKLPKNSSYAAVVTNCEVLKEKIVDDRIIELSREKWGFFEKHISYLRVLSENIAPPISLLVRKDVVNKIGVFNSDLPVLGDWDFILRILQIGDIATIDEPLAYYHHRETGHGDYGNTVIQKIDQHQLYRVRYTNAMLRDSVKAKQDNLGIYKVIVDCNSEQKQYVDKRIAELTKKIDKLHSWNFFGTKPPSRAKKTMLHRVQLELKRWKTKYLIKS